MNDKLAVPTQVMGEYAQAIRGDWSDFDGRSERSVIDGWVNEIRNPSDTTLEQWRDQLGLCPDGNGHWYGTKWGGHREAKTCPVGAKREGDAA